MVTGEHCALLQHHTLCDHLPSQYNVGQSGGRSGMDLNVLPAWIQGYTGRGVVVSVVDDGIYRDTSTVLYYYLSLCSHMCRSTENTS